MLRQTSVCCDHMFYYAHSEGCVRALVPQINSLKVGPCMCPFCVAHVSGVGCTMPKALSNPKLAFSLCAEGCDTAN